MPKTKKTQFHDNICKKQNIENFKLQKQSL